MLFYTFKIKCKFLEMTIMEHSELDKDVDILDEFKSGRLLHSSMPEALSSQGTRQVRRQSSRFNSFSCRSSRVRNEPQEHSYDNDGLRETEDYHTSFQRSLSLDSTRIDLHDTPSYHEIDYKYTLPMREQGDRPKYELSEPIEGEFCFSSPFVTGSGSLDAQPCTALVRANDASQSRDTLFNIAGVQNLQMGMQPALVLNVFSGRQEPKVKTKKKYTITNSKRRLNEDNITLLSERIGKHWVELARKLGFHRGEIDCIEHDNRPYGLKEIIHRMLTIWREKAGKKATLCVIADALIEMKLYEIAQDLKE